MSVRATQPRVLAQPEPAAFVTGLGADGVELEVGFWIRDPEEGTLAVRSAIARDVLRRFAAEEIAIPFPQREVRLVPPDAAEWSAPRVRQSALIGRNSP